MSEFLWQLQLSTWEKNYRFIMRRQCPKCLRDAAWRHFWNHSDGTVWNF